MVLSGRSSELDRVRGFDRGADDYVCKPFSYPELRGRVAALLRRADRARSRGGLRVGALEVDPPSREVRLHGDRVELSQKEFALLRALIGEPTRVFTKDELLRTIWGYRSIGATRTLDSHACRLRRKLGLHGDRFVVNVWGVGYRLLDAPATPLASARAAVRLNRGANFRPAPAWWGASNRGAHPLDRTRVMTNETLSAGGGASGRRLALRRGYALCSARLELRRRRELVARACHELRGPLTAVRLSLATMERRREAPPERLAVLDLELRRAGLALDDFAAARSGRRTIDRTEPVEVAELLEEQFDSWDGGRRRVRQLRAARRAAAGRDRARRPPAARPGGLEPRRQRARAWPGPRRADARAASARATCASRSSTTAPGCLRPSASSRAARAAVAGGAAAGWRSPRRSPSATAAGSSRRRRRAARGSASSCRSCGGGPS